MTNRVDAQPGEQPVADHPALHQPYEAKDVLQGLRQALDALPSCEMLGLVGNAIQEIESLRNARPPVPVTLGALQFAITDKELSSFFQFCAAPSTVHGHDVPLEIMERLAVIGLIRKANDGGYETTEFGVALNASQLPPPATQWSLEPSDPYRRLTELKTAGIMQRGYKISGYVLRNADHSKVCISEYSAVRWLDHKEMFNLMHGVPATATVTESGIEDAGIPPFSKDLTPFKRFVDRMYAKSAPSDEQMLAAFNSSETVIDGLHEVLKLTVRRD